MAVLIIIRHQPGTKELERLVDKVGRSFVGQMDHPLGLIIAVVFRLRVVILKTKIGQLFCEGIFFFQGQEDSGRLTDGLGSLAVLGPATSLGAAAAGL